MKSWLLRIITGLLFVFVLAAGDHYAFGADAYQKALQSYPRDIQVSCKKLNTVRDRKASYIDYRAAYKCAVISLKAQKKAEDREARLKLYRKLSRRW